MKNSRILIVEDEESIQFYLKTMLEHLGYTVVNVVSTAMDAILMADGTMPDLVLMDIMLEDKMDGIHAASHIHHNFDIPIVYLTAVSEHSVLERVKGTNPYGFIVKPVQEEVLRLTIDMAIYRHWAECQLRKNEKWILSILNNLPHAIIANDISDRIQFVNKAAEYLTGQSMKDLTGKTFRDVFTLEKMNSKNGKIFFGGSAIKITDEDNKKIGTIFINSES